MRRINQQGRSMVEMVLVIGIIGVLAITTMQIITSMYGRWQLSKTVSELRDVQRGVSDRFLVDASYDKLYNMTAEDFVKDKVAPASMLKGDKLSHSFGGEVVIEPAYSDGNVCDSDCDRYRVVFYGLPFNVCREMLFLNWQIKGGTDLAAIVQCDEEGVAQKKADWSGSADFLLPPNGDMAVNFCSENAHIGWVFK